MQGEIDDDDEPHNNKSSEPTDIKYISFGKNQPIQMNLNPESNESAAVSANSKNVDLRSTADFGKAKGNTPKATPITKKS